MQDGKIFSVILLSVIFIFLFPASATGNEIDKSDCLDGPSSWYRGTQNVTVNGTTCQRWDATSPHQPRYFPPDGRNHNYCRNPDDDLSGLWCYTTNASVKWDYCHVPKCPDDSRLIWTSLNTATRASSLAETSADPEIVFDQTTPTGSLNISTLYTSPNAISEYWAVEGDYYGNRVFFADYKSEHVGVLNLTTNVTTLHFEGMGHGIENMAYDWITNNIYWTDSELNWIVAADASLKYYSPIYESPSTAPYGLAIQARKRLMFFSTYVPHNSAIYTCDLAGHNAKPLVTHPDVLDCTGLSVDYTDDKLYWTDFTGYGSKVFSSNLDGSNRIQIAYRASSIFWSISTYLKYVYVSDVNRKFSSTGAYYNVWWMAKPENNTVNTAETGRYKVTEKPRGLTVFSHNEERSFDTAPAIGGCENMPKCDQLCLPRINATRKCICTIGYTLSGETRCITNPIQNNFLLLNDAGQGKIFQLSFTSNGSDYTAIPLESTSKPYTMAVNVQARTLYWSDKNEETIYMSNIDGSQVSKIKSNVHVKSIAYDPSSGNVFYADEDSEYISVGNTDLSYTKIIMKPSDERKNTSAIQNIALDVKNRYVYWTDTNGQRGSGEVRRMRYNGSNEEVVFNNLNNPSAIRISYHRKSLFFIEARYGIIHEVPLASLQTVNGAIPTNTTTYNLRTFLQRITAFIADIEVMHDTLYFYDASNHTVEQFDLTQGVDSATHFGPKTFFRIKALTVYSTTYNTEIINGVPNGCNNNPCSQICVPISDTGYTCLCQDADKLFNKVECSQTGAAPDNIAPSYGTSCPRTRFANIGVCQQTTPVTWQPPTWSDNVTPSNQLNTTSPNITFPALLGPGFHSFVYQARDAAGNIGNCRFNVIIRDHTCHIFRPPVLPGFTTPPPYCNDKDQYVQNVSCSNPTLVATWRGLRNKTIQRQCHANSRWDFTLLDVACVAPTTASPTTTTTTPSPTTTPGPTTTTTTTTPAPTTTTTTTTPGPTLTPGTSSKTATPVPTTKTTTTSGASSTTTTTTTTSESPNGSREAVKGTGGGGLSGGATAGIAILAVAFVIIVGLILFTVVKRNPNWPVIPVFWRRRGDTVVLRDDEGGNHYSVL